MNNQNKTKFQRSNDFNQMRRRIRIKQQKQGTNLFMVQKPDHRVVVHHLTSLGNLNVNQGSSGLVYFDGYDIIKPYKILNDSSWKHLLNVYESMRLTKMQIRVWLNNVSLTTTGSSASNCYREVITNVPNRFYEQLIVEPGAHRGRPSTVHMLKWVPIEPSDYEWYNHSQFSDMDSSKYGQINFAGVSFPTEFKPQIVVEYIGHYDFKELVKPEAPPTIDSSLLQYRQPSNEDDDLSEPESYISVKSVKPKRYVKSS